MKGKCSNIVEMLRSDMQFAYDSLRIDLDMPQKTPLLDSPIQDLSAQLLCIYYIHYPLLIMSWIHSAVCVQS